jgi:hypothetical protein
MLRRIGLSMARRPEVAGCIDLDLNFSPSTKPAAHSPPDLSVGQSAGVKAAWLRFPASRLSHWSKSTSAFRGEDIYSATSAGGSSHGS